MTNELSSSYQQHLDQSRQLWDNEAISFDDQPDHGLRNSQILTAWTRLFQGILPTKHGELLDIGCGTGSLSTLAAGLGWIVTGIDFSSEMIALAEAKAQSAQQSIHFRVMDGAFPQFAPQMFDVVLCRHVLWTLPEPAQVLQRWVRLLKPGGRLILIEGFWHTGAGLHFSQIIDLLPPVLTNISVQQISAQSDLWGGSVQDERYLIHADFPIEE